MKNQATTVAKRNLALVGLLTFLFFLASVQFQECKAEVYNFKVGHANPTSHFVHTALDRFAKAVEKESNGQIKIDIVPSSGLGSLNEMAEQLRLGTLAMAQMFPIGLAIDDKQFVVEEMPYLWESIDQAMTAMRGDLGDITKKRAYNLNLKILAFTPIGFRNMTNNVRPIYKVEDLKGLKIRIAESKLRIDAFKLMGVSATPMAFGELYTALQLGTVDGQENPISLIYSSKFYEVQKYLSLTQHIFGNSTLAFSKPIWEKLPKNIQDILQRNAVEVLEPTNLELLKKAELESVSLLKEKGMKVNEADLGSFQKALKPLYDKYMPEFIPEIRAALSKYTGKSF